MFDVLNKFQHAAAAFEPVTLVVSGVVCILLGLIIWLSGTKFTRIIAATVGFIAGGIAAFNFFHTYPTAAAIVGAVAGALIAMVIHQFIAVISGSAFFAIAAVVFLVATNFSDKAPAAVNQQQSSAVSTKLTPSQTAAQVELHTSRIGSTLYNLAVRLPFKIWLFVAIGLGVMAVLAMIFWRFVVGFACSSLGAAMISVGLIGLLLYKGSMPLTYVYERISFFSAAFAAVVVAGTISQIILCPPPKLKTLLKEQKEIDKKNKINAGEHKWTSQQS